MKRHRIDQLQAGLEQFRADHHGHGAADEEHDQAEHQVHGADVFVIGREQPALDAGRRLVIVIVVRVVSGVARVGIGHGAIALLINCVY